MPSRLLLKLADRVLPDDAEQREAFLSTVEMRQQFAPCVVWTDRKRAPEELDLPRATDSPVWLPPPVLRLAPGSQPGKHPWHDEGAFYSLDFSSVFAASALAEVGHPRRVLDVCAAPGGKSILTQRWLKPELLISNEVIGKRLAILRSNLRRCRIDNAFTQRLDPAEWAERGEEGFNLVLVDAPCSGQSLLTKGIENPGCFHPSTVQHNARRQRRILAKSAEAVAPCGHLFYSTCTFAPEENEKVIAWFLKRFEDRFDAVEVPHLTAWQSPLVDFPCYRLHPQSGLGAGAFVCLLRCVDIGETSPLPEDLLQYPVAG